MCKNLLFPTHKLFGPIKGSFTLHFNANKISDIFYQIILAEKISMHILVLYKMPLKDKLLTISNLHTDYKLLNVMTVGKPLFKVRTF